MRCERGRGVCALAGVQSPEGLEEGVELCGGGGEGGGDEGVEIELGRLSVGGGHLVWLLIRRTRPPIPGISSVGCLHVSKNGPKPFSR